MAKNKVQLSFSLATIAGTVFGFALVIGAIMHGTTNYWSFLNLHGFLIVVGGSIANAFMSYQARYVVEAFAAIIHMLRKPEATREGLNTEILRLIKWAYLMKSRGINALEGEIAGGKMKEPLLRYGLELVVSAYPPEKIRAMLDTSVEAEYERRISAVAVLRNMASTGPAFGMVGTLVGMVIMLQNIEGNMSGIGEGLAIALLATLYGILFARLICLPAADKLMQKEDILRFRNYLMTEGLVLLAERQSPRYMQDRLNSYLDPSIHFDLDNYLKVHKPPAAAEDSKR